MAVRIAFFYAAVFLFIGVHLPFWPVWLTSRGVDAAEIGIILSAAAWIRAFAPPLLAHAADRKGERKRLIAGLVAATMVAYGLFALTEGFWPLLAVTVLAALAFGAIIPLGENLGMMSAHEGGFDYGRVRLWGSLTFIVGATFGGRLLLGREPDLILVLLLGGLVLTFLAALTLPDLRPPPADTRHPPFARLLRKPAFVMFLLAAGLTQASHAALYGFATLHWRAAGIADDVIGALWAEGVIAEVALFAFSGAVARKLGPVRLLWLGVAGGIVRWGALGLTTNLGVLAVVQPLHALTFAAAHLGAMHFILRAVPAAYSATAQSLYSGLAAGGLMGFAMIATGALYGNSDGTAFLAMAGLSLASGIAVFALGRMWREGEII